MSEKRETTFNFIDLFAGIGGFHIAMHSVGGRCVFASEWDKFARQTYTANFEKISPELFEQNNFAGDINQVDLDSIPDFDVLCAGFPCQPFSHAGLKLGFDDVRGTLFFNIAEIIRIKRDKGKAPKVLLLENVKGLRGHNQGKTLKRILEILDGLGYKVDSRVLNSKYFGVPQNRERLFIVAWDKQDSVVDDFHFPLGLDSSNEAIFEESLLGVLSKQVKVGNILLQEVDRKYTISDRLFAGHLRRLNEHRARGNGFGFSLFNAESPYTSTISARYYKDGSEILIEQTGENPRKLHPIEAARLQGFPIDDWFKITVSDVQIYKQFGNSVSVPVVVAIAREISRQLLKLC